MPLTCWKAIWKKPHFSSNHRHKCLEFAKHFWNWNHVLVSEETKIEFFGKIHSRWGWCKKEGLYSYTENNLIHTLKYGGYSFVMLKYIALWSLWRNFKWKFYFFCQAVTTGVWWHLLEGQWSKSYMQGYAKMSNWP